jgi:hypothetical protein
METGSGCPVERNGRGKRAMKRKRGRRVILSKPPVWNTHRVVVTEDAITRNELVVIQADLRHRYRESQDALVRTWMLTELMGIEKALESDQQRFKIARTCDPS